MWRDLIRRPGSDRGRGGRGDREGPGRRELGRSDGSSVRSRWAIARRELGSLRSEKTIVLAIAIQLFIAAFSSFLVVGLVSLYDPSSVDGQELDVAVTGEDTGRLLATANDRDGIDARHYEDRERAYADYDRGVVAAVLDASRDDDGRLVVSVTTPDEGLQTTVLITELRDSLEAVEHDERQANADRLENRPLPLPEEVEASPYFGFTYTILLPLLLFLPVFISGSIAVDSLIEERQRGTLELLRVAPLPFVHVIDAKLLATAALAPIQAAAWLALLWINGTTIANPGALLALVAALSLLVVGFGLAVALSAPDRRQSQLLYSVGMVAALVVSALLPEHPANTVAKLAIGSETATTWLLLAAYSLAGIVAFAALRAGVSRLEADAL
ncbi:ABC transporter permease [Natrialbaceae archaeon GCM10025810]|uniref:ABC transporter permease n=1 Tax=Halovalidus salilacus TaxID=3075124 RepID=UPI00360DD4A7